MAHTPGPWKLEAGRCITTESGSFSIHSNDDWNRNWVELDENTKLMAQAPTLLAALRLIEKGPGQARRLAQVAIDVATAPDR